MFSIFTRLENGEFIFVASCKQLGEAQHLVQELNDVWPREYEVRDSEGKSVELNEYPAIHLNLTVYDASSSD
jgi:hypothetical protein